MEGVALSSFQERRTLWQDSKQQRRWDTTPHPEALTPIIARYLKPKGQGTIRIFDPCAGEGTALKTIGDHLQAETYGIEIDKKRGRKLRKTSPGA